jgi:NifU-like protein involved in Fe-S cluster formation
MVIYLCIEERSIVEVSFQTYGRPAAIACGSWLCEWLSDKALDEAALVTADAIVNGLGGLSPGKEHCPPPAIGALRDALRQLM